MRSKSILLLFLALGCGAVASIGISQVMDRNRNSGDPLEMDQIYVALADINASEMVTATNTRLEEWPKSKVPPGAVTVTNFAKIEGKRTKYKMIAGEPILEAKMGGSDAAGAAMTIPPGMRVVTVPVDHVSGSANLILPGNKVDVLVYIAKNMNVGVTETTTKRLLSNITVFAVDTITLSQREKEDTTIAAKNVSLLVSPKQAAEVTMARQMGTIQLLLRSPDDELAGDNGDATLSDVLTGLGGTPAPTAPQPQADAAPPSKGFFGAIMEQMSKAAANSGSPNLIEQFEAPFRVTVIEGDQVREVEIGGSQNPFGVPGSTPAAGSPNPHDAGDTRGI